VIQNNWTNLIKPERITVKKDERNPNIADIIAEPLERGFAITIGTALRRILLSSLQGCAITAIKIDGALHEFSSIQGMKEDVVELILNLKQVYIKQLSEGGSHKMKLSVKGAQTVTAGMIETGHDLEIINKDFVICHLDDTAKLDIEFFVGTGRGYKSSEENKPAVAQVGLIAIDSIFSPILNVAFNIDSVRVGQKTDYDKLTMTIKTNGTVSPEDAVAYAARIMMDQFSLFVNFEDPEEIKKTEIKESLPFDIVLLKKVNELELSVRADNCLKNDNIIYIGDLVQKSESDMLRTPNFGRKSLNEIKEQLASMGLSFGMKIDNWPPENIEELSRQYEDPYS
jgi:DNA-directed RNA polymerase subunit alpha